MRVAYFGPWIGEFGWELMAWQAYCRQESRNYDKSYACSFPGMEPLYEDFAEFIAHDEIDRALDWRDISKVDYQVPDDVTDHIKPVKTYRLGGEFIKFGSKVGKGYDVLIHARGISRGSSKNYPVEYWEQIIDHFDEVVCIGSERDQRIKGARDLRGIPLQGLMDIIFCSKLVVGQSSGVMHLASLCGTPHIVWGDSRTYFNETLEKRYKETWNPLNTPVEFIFDDTWRPDPELVIDAIERRLGLGNEIKIDFGELMTQHLPIAAAGGRWMITLSYVDEDSRLQHVWERKHDFPKEDMLNSLKRLMVDMAVQEELNLIMESPEEAKIHPEEEVGWH